MTPEKPLLAVPNVSEGRDTTTIARIADAFRSNRAVRLLDVHSDADHHRSVFTIAGAQGTLSAALLAGAQAGVELIDLGASGVCGDVGQHPHVGALDVFPVVYLDTAQRGAACAEALVLAHEIGEDLDVPVFLYGELAQGRTRAELRRGGVVGLSERLNAGTVQPDFGPSRMHPAAGATLVAAREPLVAFNVELAPSASIADATRIAGLIREGGAEGLPGVRAIGVTLRHANRDPEGLRKGAARSSTDYGRSSERTVAQVSMNVERPLEVPLRAVLEAVERHGEVVCAELVGLAPRAALDGFPEDIALKGFDAGVHVIENALGF